MSDTLKCWIISNLEILAIICFLGFLYTAQNYVGSNQIVAQITTYFQNFTLNMLLLGSILSVIIFMQ